MSGRPPRGATAALKRPAAGSDRSEEEGQSGMVRIFFSKGKERFMGHARHSADIEVRQVPHQRRRFGSAYVAA
jgi:hypothetical protein